MGTGMTKAERLQEMKRLYVQRAFTDIEMAERLGVVRETVYRDRIELTTEYPIQQDAEGRYRIDRSRLLSEIKVNLHEALTLYLAARKASRQTRFHQPHAASALEKLAATLRQPMTAHLLKAAERLLKQEKAPERIKILETVTQAWVEQRKVRIRYQGLKSVGVTNHVIHPYLIEPSIWSDSVYVVAYSEMFEKIMPFKIDRIDTAALSGETFDIPEDFDEQELLEHAWGIWTGERAPQPVRLRFAPAVRRRVKESIWHPLETVTDSDDGGCVWEAPIAEWQEMLPWVRGWGADCEVLEPEGLREALVKEAKALARVYGLAERKNEQDPTMGKLLRLWGKTERNNPDPEAFHPVLFHMLDVGNVARELLSDKASPRWRKVMSDVLGADVDTLADWLPWLVAMHDIGKVSAAFQQANDGQQKRLEQEGFTFGNHQWNNRPYHALTSSVFIDRGEDRLDLPDFLRQGWRDALGGHHGEFSGREARKEARYLLQVEPPEWAQLRHDATETLMGALLRSAPNPWPSPANLSSVAMALTGFIILCDWIGSDEKFFRLASNDDWQEYGVKSASRAMKAVEATGFFQPAVSTAPTEFATLFSNLTETRPLQLAIDAIPDNILAAPCLAIIEAPTGEGKTEAALALAHRLAQANGSDELYYALPTTATSNQMFTRLRKHIAERLRLSSRVGLVHGQAFLLDDDFLVTPLQNGKERNAAPDWFGSDKRKSLLMPFGVGTIDQAELAALNVRFTVLRLIGLAGKVVILDEVHAYDTYMTTIIERLLNWLSALGTSVILLSATLPTSRREALMRAYGVKISNADENPMAYPKLCVISRAGVHVDSPLAIQSDRRLAISTLHLDDDAPEDKARWLLNSVAEGGCACWITNTVERAQRIFEQVDRFASPDMERMVLHARFPLNERQKLEAELTARYGPESKRPSKGIVIGTQVLEQSLDLDFDVMVSDLAPIDFMLQRAGRLHRHAHHARPAAHAQPRLWINLHQSDDGSLSLGVDALIYDEFILRQTWLALDGCDEICLPADYRPLVEAVYNDSEPASDNPLREAWEKLQKKQEKARGEARLRLLPEPDPESSFCGQLAQLTFEESESRASWFVAQTRLGEESLSIIPLERNGSSAQLWPADETVFLDAEAPREMQKKLMRRSIRIGHRQLIEALKADEKDHPRLFTESALLKECYPLWLENGAARINIQKGSLLIKLHPQLGLVIQKEKEANE